MMLSVLIPTYNYACSKLAADLQGLLTAWGGQYEIIVAEDGSTDPETIAENKKIASLPACRHLIRTENVGRARIINFLIRETKGEWCIIMDSDAAVVSSDFITNYVAAMKTGADIVVGDLVNPETLPDPAATLRYVYEKAAEQYRTAEYRNHHPYERFSTFNIMAKRSTLLEVPFDERCTEYGYEDTLMGMELRRHGKTVIHISNPLMHLGFDDNATFLKKTETALHTLKKIEESLLPCTGIGKMVLKIKAAHLSPLVRGIYKISKGVLRRNLLSHKPNLTVFSFYKLGYYLSLSR